MPVLTVVRYAVLALVGLAALGALAVMAVQRRSINPFGRLARLIRRFTDPLLKPIERRVLRSGGNPQLAPWWMLGVAVLGGILVITAAEWVVREAGLVQLAIAGGTRSVAFVIVSWLFAILRFALLVRVLGSWVNAGRFTPWMKPFWFATEWMLAPLRRVIPLVGPFDITPIVAWFALGLVQGFVLRLL